MLSPEKPIPKQKKNNNNEHIYNLKRNLLNIQVDINTQLLYIRLKLTLNTCRCHCTKYEIFHEEFLQFLPQLPADLVTFTKEILHGKLHFLCSVWHLIGSSVYCSSFKIYEKISRFIPLSDDSIPHFSEKSVVWNFIFVR